jgi:TolB-like protein/Tfp pilus assembly protein PilF
VADARSFFAELKRRNVVRAALVYAAAVWALAQGIAQLTPVVGAPDWVARWFLVAACIGFPFWITFAWFYAWTPEGFRREEEVDACPAIARATGRKLDFWIIGIMAVAIVLLVTNQFVLRRDATGIADASSATAFAAALAKVPAKSVAVLPLANESGDPQQAYFSDGLSEELISDLTQIDGLKVIGKTSSFKFRDSKASPAEIGATLGVAHLIEGSVRQRGEQLRVVVSLIDARDGTSIWSHTYDQQLKDVFAIQSQIGEAVAAALKIELLGKPIVNEERPASGNVEAYRLMLQGRAIQRRATTLADVQRAIDVVTSAVEADPEYAYAWGVLSNMWANLTYSERGAKRQHAASEARAAVAREAALAPGTASAHRHRGYLLAVLDLDQVGALVEFRRALELAPRDGNAVAFLALQLAIVGKLQASVDLYKKAIATDPLRVDWYGNLSGILIAQGDLVAGERVARKALTLQPDFSGLYGLLVSIDVLRGDAAAAARDAEQEPDPDSRALLLVSAALAGDDHAKAHAALQDYIRKYGDAFPYSVAELYGQSGQPDKMFTWLDRTWAQRNPVISNLLYDPLVLRYKTDPRFAAFYRKLGLPTQNVTAKSTAATGFDPHD